MADVQYDVVGLIESDQGLLDAVKGSVSPEAGFALTYAAKHFGFELIGAPFVNGEGQTCIRAKFNGSGGEVELPVSRSDRGYFVVMQRAKSPNPRRLMPVTKAIWLKCATCGRRDDLLQ